MICGHPVYYRILLVEWGNVVFSFLGWLFILLHIQMHPKLSKESVNVLFIFKWKVQQNNCINLHKKSLSRNIKKKIKRVLRMHFIKHIHSTVPIHSFTTSIHLFTIYMIYTDFEWKTLNQRHYFPPFQFRQQKSERHYVHSL